MATKVPLKKPIRELWHTWLLVVALAACGAPEAEIEVGAHQRHMQLDGQANFRDLGGYDPVARVLSPPQAHRIPIPVGACPRPTGFMNWSRCWFHGKMRV